MAPEACDAFERMGMQRIADLVRQAIDLIPGGYARDWTTRRNRVLEIVPTGEDEKSYFKYAHRHFCQVDDEFFKKPFHDEIEGKMDEYAEIHANPM